MVNICFFTVETGFQASEITLLEGSPGMMCLNTFGEVFSDTVINVTLIEGTAEADGEEFLCHLFVAHIYLCGKCHL